MSQNQSNNDTQINIFLDEETNNLLEQASENSYRTKRQEASIRVSDHLDSFGSSKFVRAPIDIADKVSNVNVTLTATDNKLLMDSIAQSDDVSFKRDEAAMRLKDHLRRYQCIANIGCAIKRKC